ncbi:regulatory protein RecX [Agromyces sp. SYSU T00194]|uniref:regulatory protein RecX n=1 Tax=Agromyces chitinivorans TaxID=3158560 RepID=UPI00339A5246
MTHPRADRGDRGDAIAPVAYLPWVRPDADTADAPAVPRRSAPDAGAPGPGGLWGVVPGGTRSASADGDAVARVGAGDPGPEEQESHDAAWAVPVVGDDPDGRDGADDDRVDRVVLARLRRSSLSVSEVRRLLLDQEVGAEHVDGWIARYERLGYLDDRSFADQLAASLVDRKGYGTGAVLAELHRRGVDSGLAREVVEGLDADDERARAVELAVERARRLGSVDRAAAARRLSGYLQRRGYSGDVVREAVSTALQGTHA